MNILFEKGKTYEMLTIGDSASFSKTITESDIYQFAGICGDFNPVHVNEAYSRQTRFKKRIAHGPLTQSLIAPVLGTKLPGLGTLALELFTRFKAPVYIGDTVTATALVSEKLKDKQWVRLKLTWTNQKEETVAEGEALVIPPN
jgi:acyl dehydratase